VDIEDLTKQSTLPAYVELFDIELSNSSKVLTNPVLSQYGGTFRFDASPDLIVGRTIKITGTLTGSAVIPSYPSLALYYITLVSAQPDFTAVILSSTLGGTPITTGEGSLTGLEFKVIIPTFSNLRDEVTTYRFTPNVAGNGTPIQFGGNSYTPYPIELIGYSTTSDEAPARPTLNISNINKVFGMLSFALQDIIGAKVTYYRTFENYLNQSTKISAAPLKFTIARKTAHNPAVLSFELRSPLDADRGMLPKRQMLKRDFPGLGINKVL
jgi:hypothetical protein